ncbi:MAG TPA: acnA regulatory region 60-length spurious protein [Franconibacter pulveris]|nr:acnA regulatory region 60-length spurious protein [Franconibacter pulveris]
MVRRFFCLSALLEPDGLDLPSLIPTMPGPAGHFAFFLSVFLPFSFLGCYQIVTTCLCYL